MRLFKPRFATLVELGAKKQTVRPTPLRKPKPGDRISLRQWSGKPYRSKQVTLREATVVAVEPCEITTTSVRVGPFDESPEMFARADGFASWDDMRQWFEREHGLPFQGILIGWQNDQVERMPQKGSD
ncbi:MAG: ASCH domain-containing protein [Opitutaceae bacterium]